MLKDCSLYKWSIKIIVLSIILNILKMFVKIISGKWSILMEMVKLNCGIVNDVIFVNDMMIIMGVDIIFVLMVVVLMIRVLRILMVWLIVLGSWMFVLWRVLKEIFIINVFMMVGKGIGLWVDVMLNIKFVGIKFWWYVIIVIYIVGK